MEHYIKLQFSSENSQYFGADNLPCEIWDNLPQRHFFNYTRLTATMFEIFMFWLAHVFGKRTPSKMI